MKILQVCHKIPNPPADGGAQAIHYTTLGLLKNGVQVQVLAINTPKNWTDVSKIDEAYLRDTKFSTCVIDTRVKLASAALNLFSSRSYFVERFYSDAFARKLEEILRANEFSIIQLEHVYLCLYISVIRKFSSAQIILRPQNIEFEIWERYCRNLKNPLIRTYLKTAIGRLKKFETEALSLTDGIIALTDHDANFFKSVTRKPVITVPMGFQFSKLGGHDFEKQFGDFPQFYHLGSMNWLPNSEAIDWFVSNAWQEIAKEFPDIRVYFAGNDMPARIKRLASSNLIVEGKIDTPMKYQEDKGVMLVPLQSGSGIRAKIVEGLALGKVIISTTIGAQGIRCTHGKDILIADTPAAFLEMIRFCYQHPDECRAISKNARLLAENEYHYEKTAQEMIKFYNSFYEEN